MAYRTQKQREAMEDAQAYERMGRRIKALVGIYGSCEAVAVQVRMSETTLYRRMRHPENLTLKELRAIERLERKGGDFECQSA